MKLRQHVVPLALLASASFSVSLSAQTVEQGIQLYNARKYAEARAALLPFGERDASAAYYLGRIELDNTDAEKAAEWLERAVSMNSRNAAYYHWLGRAYGTQARRASKFRLPFLAKKIKNAWDTALALDPENLEVREDLITFYVQAPGFLGGGKDKAHEMVVEITRRNPYRGLAAEANLCAATKDMVCAERKLQEMVKSYPDSAAVYSTLARFYTSQKQAGKAFAVLERRLRIKPNELTTLYAVGRTASVSGENLDRGEQALKTYLLSPTPERGPAPAHAHYRLGTIYQKKGATALAREEYRTALQLNPKHLEAQKSLASLK